MLLEQNSELKKMNDILVSKMKELPDLNKELEKSKLKQKNLENELNEVKKN